jgi:hypothetical protein
MKYRRNGMRAKLNQIPEGINEIEDQYKKNRYLGNNFFLQVFKKSIPATPLPNSQHGLDDKCGP